jgi:hypothetical protein
VGVRELDGLLHFDPWWLLRDRADVPEAVRAAAIRTNIADAPLGEGKVANVYFDDNLASVEAVRLTRGFGRRNLVVRDELHELLRTRP